LWSSWSSWSSCPADCTTQNLQRSQSCQKHSGYSCGTAPSQSISCLQIGCTSSSERSLNTPDNRTYVSLTSSCLLAEGRTFLTFRARANNDFQIAIGTDDCDNCGTHYEIIFGGWANTRSVIRYGIGGTECDSYSQTILNQTFFDNFWISWEGNYIQAGEGGTVGINIILNCTRSTPFDVKYIYIRTGWGSSGEWRFPNDVACTHELNSNVNVSTSSTGCNGVSTYGCNSGYKQVAGNTQRTCYGKFWTGYPFVCSVNSTFDEQNQSPDVISNTIIIAVVVVIVSLLVGTTVSVLVYKRFINRQNKVRRLAVSSQGQQNN
ncbi:uncharacterized protein LOC134248196, partial [Saccostrea cucullata]|uniref:uncharacterized protein LOC134248196 n=1 Tax=Saccostrea cuccullata TaxID=36930 RepID=UPI002ED36681